MISLRGTTPLLVTVTLCPKKLNSLLRRLNNRTFEYLIYYLLITAYLKYNIMITTMTMIATASKPPITPPAIAPPEPPPSLLLLLAERPIKYF